MKKENEQLAKTLGKVTVERDWAVGCSRKGTILQRNKDESEGLDLSNKQELIESKPKEQTESVCWKKG